METVSTKVEVNIYEVKDQHGNTLSFEAEADSDGDIVISVISEAEVESVEQVRDYIADNELFDELAEECCERGITEMVAAFLKVYPEAVHEALGKNEED